MSRSKVIRWLIIIPESQYYMMPKAEVAAELGCSDLSYRYLTELIVMNDTLKSNLGKVVEKCPRMEESSSSSEG